MNKTYIREIFQSIQGEGPHVGEEQLFIRFCTCNLHCAYCDTDFEISKSIEYTPQELLEEISKYGSNLTLSLTGGEPLMSLEFLKEFLPKAKKEGYIIYLETNATLYNELENIIDYIDIVSADIKIFSATNQKISREEFDKFFQIASKKELFAKIVFNNKITAEEIDDSTRLAQKYNIEIILQPEMNGNRFSSNIQEIENIFKEFRRRYKKIRLIPQIHKFLDVR